MGTLAFWLCFLVFVGAFAAQVARRVAPDRGGTQHLLHRPSRPAHDPLHRRRPAPAQDHQGTPDSRVRARVRVLGIHRLRRLHGGRVPARSRHRGHHRRRGGSRSTGWRSRRLRSVVLAGIVLLLIRRAVVRPVALGTHVSLESVVIGLFIATLMITFLLAFRLEEATVRGAGELVGPLAGHPGVPGAHSRLEAFPPRAVADHGVPEVAGTRCRAESRFREGGGRARDGEGSREQVGARRADVRRMRALPGELSGLGRRQGAESEDDHPADAGGVAGGRPGEEARRALRGEGALAVHDVRRVRESVPGWHRASADSDRRAAGTRLERRRAGSARRRVQPSRATRQHLGARRRSAAEVRGGCGGSKSSIRRDTTCWSGSAARARSKPTSRRRCGRCSRFCGPAA